MTAAKPIKFKETKNNPLVEREICKIQNFTNQNICEKIFNSTNMNKMIKVKCLLEI